MNRNKLKTYAPLARREFIQVVTDRAAFYGLTEKKIQPLTEQDDVTVIGGQAFPKSVAAKRKRLEQRIARDGFQQTMEAMAYTWFNRFVAIRYMELHGYLDHGYRVLSAGSGQSSVAGNATTDHGQLTTDNTPEILRFAEHVDLPGIDRQTVVQMKLDGDQEPELYRMLLLAQCHALHRAMPFLFEPIDDETELLLPDNLLHSDSPIRKLVASIDEDDWQEVEIIGWLYQFYISEKKDQVIGKVVKSEDIPAATQLFTPNWIVKYLVQNSLGRLWMEHHPDSQLRAQMEYYIEPAEQTPEVQTQLQEIIRQRAAEHRGWTLATDERGEFLATDQHGLNTDKENAGDPCFVRVSSVADVSLDPEKLTLLDPACGSGHILVEAYDLLKAIYQERGYRAREIPRLILEKNLYGLEIDDRAAQLAAFALMMKARADDRRIFAAEVKLNVMAIQDSKGLDAEEVSSLWSVVSGEESTIDNEELRTAVSELIELFEHGKTFGSLIQVPQTLAERLPAIAQHVKDILAKRDLFRNLAVESVQRLVVQATILARHYTVVLANPPYMGSTHYDTILKKCIQKRYTECKADLYSCFVSRSLAMTERAGRVALITISNWLFLSAFEDFRRFILDGHSIDSLIHNGRGVWGSDFGSCMFVIRKESLPEFKATYKMLFDKHGSVASNQELRDRFHSTDPFYASVCDFPKVPGSPIAYWITDAVRNAFSSHDLLKDYADGKVGLQTSDNDRFLRYWHEVAFSRICFDAKNGDERSTSNAKWIPYNKGGLFRRWYGNIEHVVNWERNGAEIQECRPKSVIRNPEYHFREGITWSDVTISDIAVRYLPPGCISDSAGHSAYFSSDVHLWKVLAMMNTHVTNWLTKIVNPTVHFHIGYFNRLPYVPDVATCVADIARQATDISRRDWDLQETSWAFESQPLIWNGENAQTVGTAFTSFLRACDREIERLTQLEVQNNEVFIQCFGLQDELSPEVPEEQITLYRPDREEDIKRLISYAIGCMMGRYSLDRPGLIYAHSGNRDFQAIYYGATEEHGLNTDTKDPSNPCSIRVPSVANSPCSFPPDDDGIIPITDTDWFPDDAANRVVEFIATAWPDSPSPQPSPRRGEGALLEENLVFIAESLGPKKGESSRDTIRRYLSQGFFKHHLSMYKRRPIYWKFTSGKLGAFECLVYLHRYHEGTLPRMRTEYVIPLLGRIEARIEQLKDDITAATSTAHGKRLQKERDKLIKQQAELQKFDEKLRHYADRRIQLDLDDGVKVNYAKFGDLLAEVKAVTGQ